MTYEQEELRELIPLYVNKTLSEEEQGEFENSLDKYPELKKELKEFSEIKASYRGMEKTIPKPSDAIFGRIMARVKADKTRSTSIEPGIISKAVEFIGQVFAWPRLSLAVVAVQLAVIIILAGVITREGRFATLSSDYPPKGDGIAINIVFDQEAREREIRAVLKRVDAVIVNGPSVEGLYVVQVNKDEALEQILKELKESGSVKFAEKAY